MKGRVGGAKSKERAGEAKWRDRLSRADGFTVFAPGTPYSEVTTSKHREIEGDDERSTNYASAFPPLHCFTGRRGRGEGNRVQMTGISNIQ